jgi:hypothetical protein
MSANAEFFSGAFRLSGHLAGAGTLLIADPVVTAKYATARGAGASPSPTVQARTLPHPAFVARSTVTPGLRWHLLIMDVSTL